jgi:hypothetical protein
MRTITGTTVTMNDYVSPEIYHRVSRILVTLGSHAWAVSLSWPWNGWFSLLDFLGLSVDREAMLYLLGVTSADCLLTQFITVYRLCHCIHSILCHCQYL